MSDSNNLNNLVDLTGPDEPAKKLTKLLTGFFPKYDPRDPADVAYSMCRKVVCMWSSCIQDRCM